MDFSTQKTLYNDPVWFFKHNKEYIMRTIAIEVKGILTHHMDFFNQIEVDNELLKGFLSSNKDVMQVMQLIEPPPIANIRPRSYLLPSFMVTMIGRFVKDCKYHDWKICTANLETQPPIQQQSITPDIAISQPIQHQSDSMSLDDTIENTMGKVPSTPHHSNPITPFTTPLSRAQKKSAKKKLKKLQQQQQIPDDNPFIVSSGQLSEQTPFSLKNNQDKKRKQEHLTNNFNNSNLILTGYCPQQEEQA
ncbi:hypothetical protein RCL_jg11600.t1 [Rhizophagus clarus]|uniref:Uncharacterized protein n=1 Tax=Rhizophagus clarus TaxID=94130 RepID=A0A8H3L8X2_9GLOM|nr:hypothetical protein RCL_jg11600.t1 [Rhizophagus clarus]